MKKLILVLALIAACGLLLSSCKSTHSCPAYGKMEKPQPQQVS